METMEIILLIVGAALVIAGFIIPDKGASLTKKDIEYGKKQIDDMVNAELEKVKFRIEDTVDETISYAVEKTERSLERVTNEQMLNLGEYSEGILAQISKNHEEVMFLYDMLNDKHDILKNTVSEVESTVRKVETTAQDVRISVEEAKKQAEEVAEAAQEAFSGLTPPKLSEEETESVTLKAPSEKTKKKPAKAAPKREKISPEAAAATEELATGITGRNNNDRILEMHRLGKSNMAIARELGLGIGEVNLVIGLYESRK